MAVGERASPGVLAGQPDVGALEQQRPEGQRLGEGPVDLAALEQLVPRRRTAWRAWGAGGSPRADVTARRRPGRAPTARHRSRRAGAPRSPGGGALATNGSARRAPARVSSSATCELALEVVERVLGLLEGDVAPLHQRLGVELAHRAPGVDLRVHQRLGVARVVALVVAVAAVADHVDHDVLVEPLPVVEGQPGDADARLGVVAVHVEDRRLDHLGHVGASRSPSGPTPGVVVKPIWLLMIRWMVPPTR